MNTGPAGKENGHALQRRLHSGTWIMNDQLRIPNRPNFRGSLGYERLKKSFQNLRYKCGQSESSQRDAIPQNGGALGAPEQESRIGVFERIALAHLRTLLQTAIRMAPHALDAEEIVCETFLRAWERFDSFEHGGAYRTQLFRILFNVINDRRNKQVRTLESPGGDWESPVFQERNGVTFHSPEESADRGVLGATMQLPYELRAALWLVVVEGCSYRDVTEILGERIETVHSLLHRARHELRRHLISRRE